MKLLTSIIVVILALLVALWELAKLTLAVALAIFVILLLTGCDTDAEKAAVRLQHTTMPDGTECIVYVRPHNIIRGVSCDHSTKPKSVDTRPRMCDNLYNVGKHREWAECMGVGYVDDTN